MPINSSGCHMLGFPSVSDIFLSKKDKPWVKNDTRSLVVIEVKFKIIAQVLFSNVYSFSMLHVHIFSD